MASAISILIITIIMTITLQDCWQHHPIIDIGDGQLMGGNCADPLVKDFDIYVALDWAMWVPPDPWDPRHGPIQLDFSMQDGGVPVGPGAVDRYVALVDWLAKQLADGKRVHVGCIGGHGRTGTLMAAMLAESGAVSEHPVQWLRTNYCKHAVETIAQCDFLDRVFDIPVVMPSLGWPIGGSTGWA